MKGGVTGRGFGTFGKRRHAPKTAQASVRAKILARMIALGRASRA